MGGRHRRRPGGGVGVYRGADRPWAGRRVGRRRSHGGRRRPGARRRGHGPPAHRRCGRPVVDRVARRGDRRLGGGPGGRQRRSGLRRPVPRYGAGPPTGNPRGQLRRHRRPGVLGAAGHGRARSRRVRGHQLRFRSGRHRWRCALQRHEGVLDQPGGGARLGAGRLRGRHPRRRGADDGHPDVPCRRRRPGAPSPRPSIPASSSRLRSTPYPRAAGGWPTRGCGSQQRSTARSGCPC